MINSWDFSEQDLSSEPPKIQKNPQNWICSEFYVVPKQSATNFVVATTGELLQRWEDTLQSSSTTHNTDGELSFEGVHYLHNKLSETYLDQNFI